MVENTLTREIIVETMSFIPLAGHTYPLLLTTNNPPYEELIVTINVTEEAYISYITIEPQIVTFSKGESSVNYTIVIDKSFPDSSVTIDYVISGKDSG